MVAYFVPIGLMGGAKPPVLTFVASGQNTTGSGGSFIGLNFGPAAADRAIVAAVGNNSATATTAVTIGGVSASLLVSASSPFGNALTSIWIALVPTGTSGNVVISNGAGGDTTVSLYSVTSLISLSAVTTDSASGTPPQNLSVAVNGFGVAIVVGYSSGATGTASWSNLTAIDVNSLFATNHLQTTGNFVSSGPASTLNTTVNYSASNNAFSCCAVSLR